MKNVAIIFGGKSGEHEVSIASAQSITREIDRDKFHAILIGIDKKGKWFYVDDPEKLLMCKNPMEFKINEIGHKILPVIEDGNIYELFTGRKISTKIDIVFPVLHGTFGEDGTIQGLIEMSEIPYVGASVLGSSIGMDKVVSKRLLTESNIPVTPYLVLKRNERHAITYNRATEDLGKVLFIKPANLGSSVGVSRVTSKDQFILALKDAFLYDDKILIETGIIGQEIECSVLGLDELVVSVPGEVIPSHDFYSYEAKYLDNDGAELIIPARLNEKLTNEVKRLAALTFRALECEIMARVDFLISDSDKKIYVNEINTIPGFTSISMYPKMLAAIGIPYKELITRLLNLAEERHNKKMTLKRDFEQ